MDDGSAACIILFIIFLMIDAVFYGFLKAITCMNEKEIERKAEEEHDKKAILLQGIIKRSTIYVNSIQMVITIVNVVMGAFFLKRFSQFFYKLFVGLPSVSEKISPVLAVITASILLLYILLTYAILLPRKIAAKFPDSWAFTFVSLMHIVTIVLYPLTWIIAASANVILTILGLRSDNDQADVTEAEIIDMVNEGHEQGVLEASEAEMITNIFEFGDKTANDIMTHRNNIIAIDSDTPFKDALQSMLEESNSRYPVYEENLDHIIGILYLKDAMRLHTSDESLNKPVGKIKDLLREPFFIPETRKIDDLFKNMQSAKIQMAIVIDEYGQTSGLVAMEDILEEIVGNIMDEYDDDESHIEKKGENEYIIDGMTKLEELEERFHIAFDDVEFETLNGYLISKLDRIPKDDDDFEVIVGEYRFKILQVDNKMVQTVQVTKLSPQELKERENAEINQEENEE